MGEIKDWERSNMSKEELEKSARIATEEARKCIELLQRRKKETKTTTTTTTETTKTETEPERRVRVSFSDLEEPAFEEEPELRPEPREATEKRAYRPEFLRRKIGADEKLRDVFLEVEREGCGRLLYIKRNTGHEPKTISRKLKELQRLKLIERKAVLDLLMQKTRTALEQSAVNDFNDWTSKMSDEQKAYFTAKTGYFFLTERGKDGQLLEWAENKDSEFRE